MTYDHHEATTSEADAFRAGQAFERAEYAAQSAIILDAAQNMQERVNLALTHLRAELDRGGLRDTTRVRAAYRLLGGVGAVEAVEPAQPPPGPRDVDVEFWATLETIHAETLAEASARKQAEYEKQRAVANAAALARWNAMAKQVSA